MIDPNEAPEGFVAVEEIQGCQGCAFLLENEACSNTRARCFSRERYDQEYVIFTPREQSNLAEFSNIVDFAEAKVEIERLQKFATVNGVTELESELRKSKEEAARWKSAYDHAEKKLKMWQDAFRERDSMIEKLKVQLTTALETIAGMR